MFSRPTSFQQGGLSAGALVCCWALILVPALPPKSAPAQAVHELTADVKGLVGSAQENTRGIVTQVR